MNRLLNGLPDVLDGRSQYFLLLRPAASRAFDHNSYFLAKPLTFVLISAIDLTVFQRLGKLLNHRRTGLLSYRGQRP
jgi:hypothetical protein